MSSTEAAVPRPAGHSPYLVLGVPVLVLVVLAALTSIQLGRSGTSAVQRGETERAAALQTAEQVAVDYTTLDYRKLTQEFQTVASFGTKSFKTAYLTQTNGAAELIVKAKATSKGTIAASAVQNASATSADVIIAVNEAITNTKFPKGNVQSFRLELKLVHSGSKWLVDSVNQI